MAAGYADPNWVPHHITAYAYEWVTGPRKGFSFVKTLPAKSLYDDEAKVDFILPLVAAIDGADVLTGHNIIRYDLPVLNAECIRLGLSPLPPKMVQDTIRLPKTKGFKKGQDNMADLFEVASKKLPLNHTEWMQAYADPHMAAVKDRVRGDVTQHIALREEMRVRRLLMTPKIWQP